MVYGIGTDIIEVGRIEKAMERNSSFGEKIFTSGEAEYCDKMKNKYQHYAARFSAKEAFLKAIGTGWRNGITFADIDVYHDPMGKPLIRLTGKAEELIREQGITRMHVTLSHIRDLACAVVVLETD